MKRENYVWVNVEHFSDYTIAQGIASTTTTLPCTLPGDYPTCGEVTLSEIIDFIVLWSQDLAALEDVINLINAWATG